MLDQNIATLLSALLGGLLTIIGGLVASHYLQSSSDQLQKRKEIRNLVEQIYKSTQEIKLAFRVIGEEGNKFAEVENHLNEIERRIDLYLPPIKEDFHEYQRNIVITLNKILSKKVKKEMVSTEDTSIIHTYHEKFVGSIVNLLRKRGYNYF